MNKNLKKIVLCMALSTSVLVSGNTVKYFNVIDTVKADENVTTTPVITDPIMLQLQMLRSTKRVMH